MSLQIRHDEMHQPGHHGLVLETRRRAHEQLAPHDFVGVAVVRQPVEIGPDPATCLDRHMHRPVLLGGSYMASPCRRAPSGPSSLCRGTYHAISLWPRIRSALWPSQALSEECQTPLEMSLFWHHSDPTSPDRCARLRKQLNHPA